MTPSKTEHELEELLRDFADEAQPGPWWPENGVVPDDENATWLTNEGQDSLRVNAADAAMLVNALPALLAAARREAQLRAALDWAMKRLDPFLHKPECSPMKCICGFAEARSLLAEDDQPTPEATDE